MKKRHYIPIGVCVVMVLMVVASMGSHTEKNEPVSMEGAVEFYESCIERVISNCRYKVKAHNWSSAEELRKAVNLFSAKADFLRRNKQALVKRLVTNNIDKETHKVNYFLDRAFFQEVIHSDINSTPIDDKQIRKRSKSV